ncbi:heterokaryon incompatibility protein-domain-containing protein [Leptodontidium sp. MPI-SDFR-AT-0119]|nr:heterokaryon incompatibility protein-domain-containing protein [Leptodontidium sp. MPI-SDFR-AT-0119]
MATSSSNFLVSRRHHGVYWKEVSSSNIENRKKRVADRRRLGAKDEWTPSPDSKIRLDLSSKLCNRCRTIDLGTYLSSLPYLNNSCDLCQILSKIPEDARNKNPEMRLSEASEYVRIRAVPESKPKHISNPKGNSRSSLRLELVREWIRICDEGQCSRSGGCCPDPDRSRMPTRVIDVGDGYTACLVLTDKENMSEGAQYIALSHCWGMLSEKQREKSRTTTNNEKEWRTQGFPVKELPRTFQDAISVTRELGQRYLWIDSLCIIQGEGGDWATEATKMEAVFKNAYCTIAATSAKDSTDGFLNRPLKEIDLRYVVVPRSSKPSDGKVYICTSIDDDFDGDVTKGVLNTRAWVLQERALSRRTIHFTKRQTYWECGGGVRCETLTHMKNANLSFQSDPEFPRSIKYRYVSTQIQLFQSLFRNYSTFGIAEHTDRPVAIESLAKALAKALDTVVYYGIFECFLHRSLMWQPAQNASLEKITYEDNRMPPSWSWMLYHGQIQYLQLEFREVEWDHSVQFIDDKPSDSGTSSKGHGYVLEARVRRLRDCKVNSEGVILDNDANEVGLVNFDTQSGNFPPEGPCAIMGRETRDDGDVDGLERKYYVLFLAEGAMQLGRGTFTRVGMGSIQQRFLHFSDQDDMARIF